MSGLSFSGKSRLAEWIAPKLEAEIVSYDVIYTELKPTFPSEISKVDEWEKIEKEARRRIARILQGGRSVIYDDLSVERVDRDRLRQLAEENDAAFKVVFLDTPLELIRARQRENEKTRERGTTSESNMQLVISQLSPPGSDEAAVVVTPDTEPQRVLAELQA